MTYTLVASNGQVLDGLDRQAANTALMQALLQAGWRADPDGFAARVLDEAEANGEAVMDAIGANGACSIRVRALGPVGIDGRESRLPEPDRNLVQLEAGPPTFV